MLVALTEKSVLFKVYGNDEGNWIVRLDFNTGERDVGDIKFTVVTGPHLYTHFNILPYSDEERVGDSQTVIKREVGEGKKK